MIRFGQYVDGHSFLHRLDPRVKTICTIVLSVLIFRAAWAEVLLISLFFVVLVVSSGLRIGALLRTVRPLVFFAGLLFALHLLFTDGRSLLAVPVLRLHISQEGLSVGAHVAWQFIALVLGGAVLTMTTPPSEMVAGLEKLMGPLKYLGVPTQDIAVMVSMAMRFVPTLLEEFERIRAAQTARGADIGTGPLRQRIKAASAMVLPLLMGALRRAEDLAEAMEARGYGSARRTTLRVLKIGGADYTALAGMVLFVALLTMTGVYIR